MRLLSREISLTRALVLLTLTSIVIGYIAIAWISSRRYVHALDPLLLSRDFVLFILVNVPAPAFIGYRVATAPPDSVTIGIAVALSAIVAFLLYTYVITCNFSVHCDLYLFLALVMFYFSAFVCIFPKWRNQP
jgi:hypothetical protein